MARLAMEFPMKYAMKLATYAVIDGTTIEVHASVTRDRIYEAFEDPLFGTDKPGICLSCGADATGCEPDASQHECEGCGRHTVYRAEYIMWSLE